MHGIFPLFRLHLGVVDDIKAISSELVAEEEINEVNLADDIHKVENLAKKVSAAKQV